MSRYAKEGIHIMSLFKGLPVIALLLITSPVAFAGTVLHVDETATFGGDGLSWAFAFTDLQDALDSAAMGDEIWVAAGTYVPSAPKPGPGATFSLQTGVAIYGGFAGVEASRGQRDALSNTCTLGGETTPVGHIVTGSGTDATAILDGFTITGGVAENDADYGLGGSGGGLYINGGSPTIVDCLIESNLARVGAGVKIIDGSPTFTRCSIRLNYTANSGDGGGVHASVTPGNGALITFNDCVIEFNTAYQNHFATGHGGGIWAGEGVDLEITGCTFTSNYGFHNQSYGDANTGGAICHLGTTATIRDSVFTSNYSAFGAGVYSTGTLTCVNCVFTGNRAVGVGCSGPECNNAPDVPSGHGGGVYAVNATLSNCTMAGNWAARSSAGALLLNGLIENSILWANVTYPVCCGEDPLILSRQQVGGNADIRYSCVAGLFTPEPGEDPVNPSNFPGSTESDPRFTIDPVVSSLGTIVTAGDFILLPDSPCIDAGDNGAVPAGTITDVVGNPRFVDDPNVPDTGLGTDPIVDIGAYERGPETGLPGDVNGDGLVDVDDLVELILQWGPCPASPAPCSGDSDDDGMVGVDDLVLVIINWT